MQSCASVVLMNIIIGMAHLSNACIKPTEQAASLKNHKYKKLNFRQTVNTKLENKHIHSGEIYSHFEF